LLRAQRLGATGPVDRALSTIARLPMPVLRLASRGLRTYLRLQRCATVLRRSPNARAGTHAGFDSAITIARLFGHPVAYYSPGPFTPTRRLMRFLNRLRASTRRRLSDSTVSRRLKAMPLAAAIRRLADKMLPYD
jgi:hypothetical protein